VTQKICYRAVNQDGKRSVGKKRRVGGESPAKKKSGRRSENRRLYRFKTEAKKKGEASKKIYPLKSLYYKNIPRELLAKTMK